MNFTTICDEETMRLTYPGAALHVCFVCLQTVCLDSDLDSEGGEPVYICPQCQARRRELYALGLVGDKLAPRYLDGDELVIDPRPKVISPGDAVIADVQTQGAPRFVHSHTGAYIVNADGDLYDLKGGHHAAGTFRITGLVIGVQQNRKRG